MQTFILDIVENPKLYDHWDRIIWIVYEPVGNTGKSLLYSWFEMKNMATCQKPKKLEDLQRAYMDELKKGTLRKWIMVDLPRRTAPEEINACLHAMEGVKGGRLTEDRNYHQSMRIPGGPPHMMIFMNDPIPDFDCLTHDRFRMIYIEVPEKMRAQKYRYERWAVAIPRHISVREIDVVMRSMAARAVRSHKDTPRIPRAARTPQIQESPQIVGGNAAQTLQNLRLLCTCLSSAHRKRHVPVRSEQFVHASCTCIFCTCICIFALLCGWHILATSMSSPRLGRQRCTLRLYRRPPNWQPFN
jgi:hypothetical protein